MQKVCWLPRQLAIPIWRQSRPCRSTNSWTSWRASPRISPPGSAGGWSSSPSSTAAAAGPDGVNGPARSGSRGGARSRHARLASTSVSRASWRNCLARLSTMRSSRGRLSYAKVRALTRVGDPANEAELLGLAARLTASQLERAVRAYRRVSVDEARETHEREELTWYWDDATAPSSCAAGLRTRGRSGVPAGARGGARNGSGRPGGTRRAVPRNRGSRRRGRRRSRRWSRSRTRRSPVTRVATAATATRWWCTSSPPRWRTTPTARACSRRGRRLRPRRPGGWLATRRSSPSVRILACR